MSHHDNSLSERGLGAGVRGPALADLSKKVTFSVNTHAVWSSKFCKNMRNIMALATLLLAFHNYVNKHD